jgi:hypothetical protein
MDQQITRNGKPEEYLSYVLRLWCEGKQGGRWLSSLQNPITGERTGFACMDELFEFLHNMTSPEEMLDTCKGSEEVTDHNSIDNPSIGDC